MIRVRENPNSAGRDQLLDRGSIDPRYLLLLACFFLSGLAGLIYQTAWMRQFALVFGTSELAIVTVLAAYMAGLALGAVVAGRYADRLRRPVVAYALLEAGFGLAALGVPVAIDLTSRLQIAWLGGADSLPEAASLASALFYLISSFIILLVPTSLMGATLPLLARWAVRHEAQIAPRIGALYTMNTAGAAGGTLLAAFLLLPRLGLGRTVLTAVAVNGVVFLLAVWMTRGERTLDAPPVQRVRSHGRFWILPLMLFSGAVSFTWEIVWTRLLAQLLGGSVYAFATMLATFLVGIALGSLIAARFATDEEKARSGFVLAQLGIAGLSLLAFGMANRLPEMSGQWGSSGSELLLRGASLTALTLLPAAIAIGATFPLAVRIFTRDARDVAASSARVFAWNTVGAIAGALATGYLVLPSLGFAGTAAVTASISVLLAALAALIEQPRRPMLAVLAGLSLLALAVFPPATPWNVLWHSPLAAPEIAGDVVHLGVGRSATVLMTQSRTSWRLTTNGLPESLVAPSWERPGRFILARWLSLLPIVARPEARSMLVIGLGAGVTIEDIPASVESIHVVELEPEVVRANQQVGALRWRDPLADPRLKLHLNDARGALRLTEQRFDTIVSQPSHPWTSGASHLFTHEFFQLVHERLNPEGVFAQWMGLTFVDEALLRSLVATLANVFTHVELYQPQPGAILLLASDQPLDLTATLPQALRAAQDAWSRLGVLIPDDILVARIVDADGARRFGADAPLITDAHNLFQTRSPTVLRHPLGVLGADRIFAAYDPLLGMTSDKESLYLVRRLIRNRALRRAQRLAESLTQPAAKRTAMGLTELARGRQGQAETAFRQALRIDPQFSEASYALLTLERPTIARGYPPRWSPFADEDPAAVVIAGWRSSQVGDWRTLHRHEDRLAAIQPRHPFFNSAVRLRSRWRVESQDPARAKEALDLLEPLLVLAEQPVDLILRAKAAVVAGEPKIALSELSSVLPKLARRPALFREVRSLLESLEVDGEEEVWRRELLSKLHH